jgi:hypothetical protein
VQARHRSISLIWSMTEPHGQDEISTGSLEAHQPGVMELPTAKNRLAFRVGTAVAWRERVHLGKIALFAISLFLFVLAITLMKDGARGLAPLVQDLLSVNSPANSLGFGWLSAYVIKSGSPVAAAALTFFDSGVLHKLGAFAMITGSRLGASFIVLFLGFLYVLRGRDRATSLSMVSWPKTVVRSGGCCSTRITQKIIHPERRVFERMCIFGQDSGGRMNRSLPTEHRTWTGGA